MIDYLIFGDFDSRDYNLAVVPRNSFDNPKREMRRIDIPGRNGSLYEDLGYFKNTKTEYDLIAYNIQFADVFFSDIKKKFFADATYKRLEDSDNPECYMMATVDSAFSVRRKSSQNDMFVFSITFDRKPQKFLKNGEYELINPNSVYNPSAFPSSPAIKFRTVEETGSIVIGGNEIFISNAEIGEDLEFDAETFVCKDQLGRNRNELVYTKEKVLIQSGTSEVSTSGVVQVKIIPRWWKL